MYVQVEAKGEVQVEARGLLVQVEVKGEVQVEARWASMFKLK